MCSSQLGCCEPKRRDQLTDSAIDLPPAIFEDLPTESAEFNTEGPLIDPPPPPGSFPVDDLELTPIDEGGYVPERTPIDEGRYFAPRDLTRALEPENAEDDHASWQAGDAASHSAPPVESDTVWMSGYDKEEPMQDNPIDERVIRGNGPRRVPWAY